MKLTLFIGLVFLNLPIHQSANAIDITYPFKVALQLVAIFSPYLPYSYGKQTESMKPFEPGENLDQCRTNYYHCFKDLEYHYTASVKEAKKTEELQEKLDRCTRDRQQKRERLKGLKNKYP